MNPSKAVAAELREAAEEIRTKGASKGFEILTYFLTCPVGWESQLGMAPGNDLWAINYDRKPKSGL